MPRAYRNTEYEGDLWARTVCLIRGHHWLHAGDGRYCNHCWRVEGND